MNKNSKGSSTSLFCNVCNINFNTNADYALHEFSKRHCDKLIKLVKQKQVVSKQKAKSELPEEKKEEPKINNVAHTGSFAKYGYFVPGEIYANGETSKEFNTEYDPYLQKFAENPFKEKFSPPPTEITTGSFTSKKKKKKIKTCTVCDITLLTVPEYETHMKSSEHIWKLKVTGMGVSAHFVKASTDLHTTDISDGPKLSQTKEQTPPVQTVLQTPAEPFPVLYCNNCKELFNSSEQYNTHISTQGHIDAVKKDAEKKTRIESLKNPSLYTLYCFSCKVSLNTLFQYNEHKNGRKHKTKCIRLVKNGITIPPEERVPGIPSPNTKKTVYPSLYEKYILEKQKLESSTVLPVSSRNNKPESGESHTDVTNPNEFQLATIKTQSESLSSPKIIFHKNQTVTHSSDSLPEINGGSELRNQISIITGAERLNCSVCCETFEWQTDLDSHLKTESHFQSILKLKSNGTSDDEILQDILADRNVVKPNELGKLTCSICNILTDNVIEFNQHLNSNFHEYATKEYKAKRSFEVKNLVGVNEEGIFYCKLCETGWPTLVGYTEHLHIVKHKSISKTKFSYKSFTEGKLTNKQSERLMKNTWKFNRFKRSKMKRPQKVDQANTEIEAPIRNPEQSEPKTDSTEKASDIGPEIKRTKMGSPVAVSNDSLPPQKVIPPLLPGPGFPPRFIRPGLRPPARHWLANSSPYPPASEAFCGRPPYMRPPWFRRSAWPRYR